MRLRGSDTPSIKTVLGTGADRIIVSQIESADAVLRVVEANRYSPPGKRGLGPRRANQELSVSVQIANVDTRVLADEIVAVEGFDSIVIGLADLSNSMGYLGQLDPPEVVVAFGTIIEKTKAAGKFVGMGLGADEDFATRQYAGEFSGCKSVATFLT